MTHPLRRSTVRRAPSAARPQPIADPGFFAAAETLALDYAMGAPPSHRPRVEARLLYDDRALYVRFDVDDRFTLAEPRRYQGQVCRDSCVELFFTPGGDLDQGYFNIEVNCAGACLFHHQQARGEGCVDVSESDAQALRIWHSMPSVVLPEIEPPVSWAVSYRVPFTVLRRYALVAPPATGVVWRANVYKCADGSSHPHWLTWAIVDLPEPDFHQKRFFGELAFA